MQLHLFGASTASGEALRQLAATAHPDWPLWCCSRRPATGADAAPAAPGPASFLPVDLGDPDGFRPALQAQAPGLWISFAPIWLLAPFLARLAVEHPARLGGLRGLIACSSSSVLTKRFAANRFDRQLVARLSDAEASLLESCHRLGVPCCILQPTLIYGQVGPYGDRNLSRLLAGMRRLPLLPLPAHTGLRQPIHARQLAAVALRLAERLAVDPGTSLPDRLALGGDQQLSYRAMLEALQRSQPADDPARRCRLLPLPDRLIWFLAAPLLLRSPRAYEAVLRTGADLAGFTPSHQLLGQPAQPFPLP